GPGAWLSATYATPPLISPAHPAAGSTAQHLARRASSSSRSSGHSLVCGLADRRHHLRIARAPAEVTRDAVADLLFRGSPGFLEQRRRRHQDAGDAEAALRHAVTHERVLQRMP